MTERRVIEKVTLSPLREDVKINYVYKNNWPDERFRSEWVFSTLDWSITVDQIESEQFAKVREIVGDDDTADRVLTALGL